MFLLTWFAILFISFTIARHPDRQVIIHGEATKKEYDAYIEYLNDLMTDDVLASKYCATHSHHQFFTMFRVTARCPETMRLLPPRQVDGAKYTCSLNKLQHPCIIYSFGSENNFLFEDGIKQFGCEVHTFDCFVKEAVNVPVGTTFHSWCVGGSNGEHGGRSYFDIPTIMQKLNHTRIDMIKMDIEGDELGSLPVLAQLPYESRPAQLAVEIHPMEDAGNGKRTLPTLRRTLKLMLQLHDLGYRLMSREDNDIATCCSEFVYGLPDRLPGAEPITTTSLTAKIIERQ